MSIKTIWTTKQNQNLLLSSCFIFIIIWFALSNEWISSMLINVIISESQKNIFIWIDCGIEIKFFGRNKAFKTKTSRSHSPHDMSFRISGSTLFILASRPAPVDTLWIDTFSSVEVHITSHWLMRWRKEKMWIDTVMTFILHGNFLLVDWGSGSELIDGQLLFVEELATLSVR